MPGWLSIPLYLGALYALFHGWHALNSIANARRLKAKAEHQAFLQRHLMQDRMPPPYQPKHESRHALRKGHDG